MENWQTKLVDTVEILFQTRVQFPPSPQYTENLSLTGRFFVYMVVMEKLKGGSATGAEPGPEKFSAENYRGQFPMTETEDFNSQQIIIVGNSLL